MQLIVAPNHYHQDTNRTSLFLAGGITNCPDWQADVIYSLWEFKKLDILNPRRPDFDTSDGLQTVKQIEWEYDMLQKADIILFWFPAETVCPITLYEFGFQMGLYAGKRHLKEKTKQLFVGTHPEYRKRLDVIEQYRLANGSYGNVHDSLKGNLDWLTSHLRALCV